VAAGNGDIDELVVDQNHRSRGIGGLLLQQLISIARSKGCRRIELDSALRREEAHRFYERHGFKNRAFLFSKPI
jgi:GNAT superfamily N-acetyltransferase